jgi:hypothetical protein
VHSRFGVVDLRLAYCSRRKREGRVSAAAGAPTAIVADRRALRPRTAPIGGDVVVGVSALALRMMRRGLKSVRAGAFGSAALSLYVLLWAASAGLAQSPPPSSSMPAAPPPLPGFVPPYEITKIVRSAGFNPLAPPRREGTTYVLRATDFRGILMRVVVDARSGAIRAVNRIVPAYPPPYGPVGMVGPYGEPPPYGAPPYGAPPPYGVLPPYGPPDIGGSDMIPGEAELGPPIGPPGPPPGARSGMYPPTGAPLAPSSLASAPATSDSPPLPRPRPAGLASREAQPGAKPVEAPVAKPEAAPASASAPAPPASSPKRPASSTPIPD